MKYNKAMGKTTLAILILTGVVLITLLNFTGNLANIMKKGTDVETCRLSVLAQAQTKLAGESPLSLQCSRRNVKFFEDKVEINGKKESKYRFEELNEETVNKVMAEELRLCWYMMGEGKVNVFEQEKVEAWDNLCSICSEINFDENIPEIKYGNLVVFLKTNKIPNSDVFYFDYLINTQIGTALIPWVHYSPWGYVTTNLIEDSAQYNTNQDQFFDPSNRYVVYFKAMKAGWVNEKLLKSSKSSYYIGLGEPSRVVNNCRLIVN